MLFESTQACAVTRSIILRRDYMQKQLAIAWAEGRRICVLESGGFAEGRRLIGRDLSKITIVDTHAVARQSIHRTHGLQIVIESLSAFLFLEACAAKREQFDLIYSLRLPEALNNEEMTKLHKCLTKCLSRNGQVIFTNLAPTAEVEKWVSETLEWRPYLRSAAQLSAFAANAGMTAENWYDISGCSAYSKLRHPSLC